MSMAPEDVDWMAGKIREQAFEIERLRAWLEWLGGEMAQRALRGELVPQPRALTALQRKLEELR